MDSVADVCFSRAETSGCKRTRGRVKLVGIFANLPKAEKDNFTLDSGECSEVDTTVPK